MLRSCPADSDSDAPAAPPSEIVPRARLTLSCTVRSWLAFRLIDTAPLRLACSSTDGAIYEIPVAGGSPAATVAPFSGTVGAPVPTTRSYGSRYSVPPRPARAERSGACRSASTPSLLASTTPPSPPRAPPRTRNEPSTVLECVLSTATVPPRPLPRPSAATTAPCSIDTRRAVPAGVPGDAPPPSAATRPAAARPSVVPSATVPPEICPLALTRAPWATVTVSLAVTAIEPPISPRPPSASTRPSIRTDPPTPATAIRPVRPPTLLAWIRPPACTRSCTIPSAARAVISTEPPSAKTVPLFVTSAAVPPACLTDLVTSIETNPSPYRSIVCAPAPASTTRPRRALITPELTTRGATSAARPASLTVIVPALLTTAPGLGAWSNTIRPAMKFWFVIPGALAIRLCALTCAPRWNTTPDGLVMMMLPFATICPAIFDGSGPVTRFSVTALVLGWLNRTACCAPTSNPCQSIAARWLDWLITVCAGLCPMLAAPATTCPPTGRALGAGCADTWPANTNAPAACNAVPRSNAPRPCRTVPTRNPASVRRAIERPPSNGEFKI